ncbi:MAG: NAD(+)/NADH kinase, partial [Cyanobacteriota bacterium]
MPKIGIIYNDNKPIACRVAQELAALFQASGYEAVLETGNGGLLGYSQPDRPICHTRIEHLTPPHFDETMPFAVVLGGDGTVLSAFRQMAPIGIPLLTINTGHMGFLTELYLNQLSEAIEQLLAGDYRIEERSMLTVRLFREQTVLWEALSLNEMVLHREPLTSM